MAIYHLTMKPIARNSGRSAVAAAAYRSGQDLVNERDGQRHDFTRRGGVDHTEIVLPPSVQASWAQDRSALWNAAESAEQRKDARVAREIEVSLPHELTPEQRLALTRGFAQDLAERFGVAVDFAIHAPHAPTDERNHHAHLMLTTRRIEQDGLGEKSELEWENKKLVARGLPTTHEQLRALRVDWEQSVNLHLARAGLDVRVDHRSHAAQGIAVEPTQHQGVHATQMQRRGKEVSRERLVPEVNWRNAQAIQKNPEQVLSLVTNEKSVFDRHDVARALHRLVDNPAAFQSAFIRVMASKALVELQPERRDGHGVVEPARYSTREMVAIEREMARATDRLLAGRGASVPARRVQAAMANRPALSSEQREAVLHVTGESRIAAVVGLAGAGKSTMLAAAREAWEAGGYRVHGAALAGKAAEGLQTSSAIVSRTLASWQMSWGRGFDTLNARDVLVIDEAGMVGSRQLAAFVKAADQAGAKVVLVGDAEQLQPIGAGAAFRAVAERTGFAALEGVRRQSQEWQRGASRDFGQHRTAQGLAAYVAHGDIRLEENGDAARAAIVREVLADRDAWPEGSRLVLAHRRVDVQALNQGIRAARQARGELAGEVAYQTSEGVRLFAPGDRILFRQNDRALGVKNGVLGTVERAGEGRLDVRLDSEQGEGRGQAVTVDVAVYDALDHGYATTIHKAQGATVDRSWVLASGSMDRHLTYVAMTRHREEARLYAGRDEFKNAAVLSERLSRGGAKETTLDYDNAQERAQFAQRRGMWLDSDIVVTKAPPKEAIEPKQGEKAKGRFDGLQFTVRKMAPMKQPSLAAAVPEKQAKQEEQVPTRAPSGRYGQPPADGLRQAIEQFAVAWNDAQRPEGQGLAAAARQAAALQGARHALDLVRPEASKDLISALKHDPQVRQAMTGLRGRARTEALVAGIEREAVVRQDPRLADVRAQRASQEAAAPAVSGRPRQWPEPEHKLQRGRGWSR